MYIFDIAARFWSFKAIVIKWKNTFFFFFQEQLHFSKIWDAAPVLQINTHKKSCKAQILSAVLNRPVYSLGVHLHKVTGYQYLLQLLQRFFEEWYFKWLLLKLQIHICVADISIIIIIIIFYLLVRKEGEESFI